MMNDLAMTCLTDGVFPSILVTGAAGFVGRAVCDQLRRKGWQMRGVGRTPPIENLPGVDFITRNLETDTAPGDILKGVRAVVHLAARTHVTKESGRGSLVAYRRANVDVTQRLAEAAAASGVRRFVFVSSIKVNGETSPQSAFSERAIPAPLDAYGTTKWEAERALHRIAVNTGLEIVILRPPLVYGPGVKGNFLRLLSAVQRGLPLPFGAVRNRRSMIYVENLASAIVLCLSRPEAANQTFLVSDGEDVSTPQLIRRMAQALGVPPRLLPIPPMILDAASPLFQTAAVDRLIGSLYLDIAKIRKILGWCPVCTLDLGLRRTAEWYRSRH
jgi:nucleoside-diphosphate-sugar epimerase